MRTFGCKSFSISRTIEKEIFGNVDTSDIFIHSFVFSQEEDYLFWFTVDITQVASFVA